MSNFFSGTAEDDLIFGSDADDSISSGDGDDTISGSSGNDVVSGGAGKDTFVYAAGWGQDTIEDFAAGKDSLDFSQTGLQFSQITISQQGDDVLLLAPEGDSLLILGAVAADFDATALSLEDEGGSESNIDSDTQQDSANSDLSSNADTVVGQGSNADSDAELDSNGDQGAEEGGNADVAPDAGGNSDSNFDLNGNTDIEANLDEGVGGNTDSNADVAGNADFDANVDGGGNIDSNTDSSNIDLPEPGTVFTGSANNDIVQGGVGNDTISSGLGDDTILAEAGDDVVRLDGGADWVSVGEGSDTIEVLSDWGADTLSDFDLDEDRLDLSGAGLSFSDITVTQQGQDVFVSDGAGNSLAILNATAESFDRTALGFGNGNDDPLVSAANLDGTAGDDLLDGTSCDDLLVGDGGRDTIRGLDGNDTLYGGACSDTLYGGFGSDLLNGGDGADRINTAVYNYFYSENGQASDADTVYGGAGDDYISVGNGTGLVYGGDGSDTVKMSRGDDTVYGGRGDDHLLGSTLNGGVHWLYGEAGNDDLEASGGSFVFGGEGNDSVSASGANRGDVLTVQAGSGDDYVVIANTHLNITLGDGNDTAYLHTYSSQLGYIDGTIITDFSAGDVLETQYLATSSHLSVQESGDDAVLLIDRTGSGGIDAQIIFEGLGDENFAIVSSEGNGGYTVRLASGDNSSSNGDDVMQVSSANGDSLFGGDGADSLLGGVGDDTLNGGNNNDHLEGKGGNDLLLGGEGDDFLQGGANSDVLYGNSGSDYLKDLEGNDTFYGGDHGDEIHAGDGDNFISGGNGDDYISSADGADTILGGDGADTIYFNDVNNLVDGGAGSDFIDVQYAAHNSTVSGGDGNDRIEIDADNAVVRGDAGNDTLSASYVVQGTLEGGDGNDRITSHGGTGVYISGGSGRDTLVASSGSDTTLEGGDSHDVIEVSGGSSANYFISAGSGADIVRLGGGVGYLDLGSDSNSDGLDLELYQYGVSVFNGTRVENFGAEDYISFDTSSYDTSFETSIEDGNTTVTFTIGEHSSSIVLLGVETTLSAYQFGGHTRLYAYDPTGQNIDNNSGGLDILGSDASEEIVGTDGGDRIAAFGGNDTLSGGCGDDTIMGGDGDDQLRGGRDADYLVGGNGDDFFVGGLGADFMDGGLGDDTLSYADDTSGIRLYIGGSIGSSYDGAHAEGDKFSSIETFIGSDFADNIYSGSYADHIVGGDGNDTLQGYTDSDLLVGGDGDDILYASATYSQTDSSGNDTLIGGNGQDQIFGAGGADFVEGGAGDDIIAAYGGDDTVYGGLGNDDISSSAGNSYLSGGAGNDNLEGSTQSQYYRDTLVGGTGDDTLTNGEVLQFESGWGHDVVVGFSAEDILDLSRLNITLDDLAIEQVGANTQVSYDGNSIVILDFNSDELDEENLFLTLSRVGGGNDDSVEGSVIEDTLTGGNGDDTLRGFQGDDALLGGSGSDKIFGGQGEDTLTGGSGADHFFLQDNDIITDFELGVDTLSLSGSGVGFFDISITSEGSDALVWDGSNLLARLLDFDAADLRPQDMVFDDFISVAWRNYLPEFDLPENLPLVETRWADMEVSDERVEVEAGSTVRDSLYISHSGGLDVVGQSNSPTVLRGEFWGDGSQYLISDVSNGSIENHATIFAFRRYDVTGIYSSSSGRLDNYGDVTAVSGWDARGYVAGTNGGEGEAALRNEGSVTALSYNGTAFGIVVRNGYGFVNVGEVLADGNRGATAILYEGNDAVSIRNEGTITARTQTDDGSVGIHIETVVEGQSVINTGSIEADTAILFQSSFVNYDPFITNSGQIIGDIELNGGVFELTNSGTIDGAISFDEGNDSLTNDGTITGNIAMLAGNDVLENSGDIIGDVNLGDGDNFLDSSKGSIEGTISTGHGDDTIIGSEAADTISGGDGADYIDGSSGKDVASYESSYQGVRVDLGEGTATGGQATGDTLASIEGVLGSNQQDTLTGNSRSNILSGNGARDFLSGKAGDDTLTGGNGDDVFIYTKNDETDLITDFDLGRDIIDISDHRTDFASLDMAQVGDDTQITFGAGDVLILAAISAADLTEAHFSFDGIIPDANEDQDAGQTIAEVLQEDSPWAPLPAGPTRMPEGLATSPMEVSEDDALEDYQGILVADLAGQPAIHVDDEISYDIFGGIWAEGLGSNAYVEAIRGDSRSEITNSGQIVAVGSVYESRGIISSGTVFNSGEIYAVSVRGSATGVITDPLETAFNSGHIEAWSGSQLALGVYQRGGHEFINEGSILAQGRGSATGYHYDDTGNGFLDIHNSGSIVAIDNSSSYSSVAVKLDFSWQTVTFSNEGVMQGEYSLVAEGSYGSSLLHVSNSGEMLGDIQVAEATTNVVNSGNIDGTVDLFTGDDTIQNSGIISGDIYFGKGDDLLLDSAGSISGQVFGEAGDDTLRAGHGNDTLDGGLGNDLLEGGACNDLLSGGIGVDTIIGGAGSDTASYASSFQGVHINLSENIFTGGDATDDVVSGIENLIGSDANDTLIGDAQGNSLAGGALRDFLTGNGGDDTLAGGNGDDVFVFGAGWGQDTITDFEIGSDFFDFTSSGLAFGDLAISQNGSDVVVGDGVGNAITLQNLSASDLVEASFVFDGNIPAANEDAITGPTPAEILKIHVPWAPLPSGIERPSVSPLEDTSVFKDVEQIYGYQALYANTGYRLLDISPSGEFTNAGLIWQENTTFGTTTAGIFANGNQLSVNNSGTVVVLTETAYAQGINAQAGWVNNTGNVYAVSDKGSATAIVSTPGYSIPNANQFNGGHVESWSGGGLATGVLISDGARFTNEGDILAQGRQGAVGVSITSSDALDLINSGNITAVSGNSDSDSIGIQFTRILEGQSVVNSGHIEADVAIHFDAEPQNIDPLVLNTGTIIGDILMEGGVFQLGNTGSISGEILFGGGDDSLNSTSGTIDGPVYGAGGNDTLIASDLADVVFGGIGADNIVGGLGDDTLIGGVHGDFVDGGAGVDTASYHLAAVGVSVNLQTGQGTAGEATDDTLAGIENLIGSLADDTLIGSSGNNVLMGGRGADLIAGGCGDDTLTGGQGADAFSLSGNWGQDVISDFTAGVDVIEVSATGLQYEGFTITQVGDSTEISDGAGNTLLLNGVSATEVTEDSFSFDGTLPESNTDAGSGISIADVLDIDDPWAPIPTGVERPNVPLESQTYTFASGVADLSYQPLLTDAEEGLVAGGVVSSVDLVNNTTVWVERMDQSYATGVDLFGNNFENLGTITVLAGHSVAGVVLRRAGDITNWGDIYVATDGNFAYGIDAGSYSGRDYNYGRIEVWSNHSATGYKTFNSFNFENHGALLVSGEEFAVGVKGRGGTLVNSGDIRVINDVSDPSYGVSADGFLTLINSGNIDADTAVSARGVDLDNTGNIVGDIVTSSGHSEVVNEGQITGDISFANGNDFLTSKNGTLTGSVSGGGGNDTLIGSAGDDTISGDTGDDKIAGGAGDDSLIGGDGADSFHFSGAWGDDTISDYVDGTDTIFIRATDFDFDDLEISQQGDNALVEDGGGNSILLLDVEASSLRANDFDIGSTPTITAATTDITTIEDSLSYFPLEDIVVAPEGGGQVSVTLSLEVGELSYSSNMPSVIKSQEPGYGTVTLTGSVDDINTYLHDYGVRPRTSYGTDVYGDNLDQLTITVSDDGGLTYNSVTLNVDVAPENDSPYLTGLPQELVFREGSTIGVDFGDFAIGDVDSESMTATFAVSSGVLVALDGAGIGAGVVVSGSGGNSVTITGLLEDVNAFIGTPGQLSYRPDENTVGPEVDQLSITINDGDGSEDLTYLGITIDVLASETPYFGSDEFTVNTNTGGGQHTPEVTVLSNGNFVVTWSSDDADSDNSYRGIVGQIFDASGQAVGDEFTVNSSTYNDQEQPSVTALENGGFVVTWQTDDSSADGSSSAIIARLFDNDGTPAGDEVLVNSITNSGQYDPSVTSLDTGGFVVVWQSYSADGDNNGLGISARVFDASGAPQGAEFTVNNVTIGNQDEPSVSSLENGGFIVSWTSNSASVDSSNAGIAARIYDSSGQPVGRQFTVNSLELYDQEYSSVTGLEGGGFVVTWSSRDPNVDGSWRGISAQLYDADGDAVGKEFTVNTGSYLSQYYPDVISVTGGGFLVAWTTAESDQDGVFAQLFDADGESIGAEFRVNQFDDDDYWSPYNVELAEIDEGRFIAVWTTSNSPSDDAHTGISGRIITLEEVFVGTAGADYLVGEGGGQLIEGKAGDDTLDGGLGDDILLGGSGADLLLGSSGNDELDGGCGDDALYGSFGDDQLQGGEGADLLAGDQGDDTLFGGAGQDSLTGGACHDKLFGGDGADELSGGSGRDDLKGMAGNDLLDGGCGDDTLQGGDGRDTLIASSGADSLSGGNGDDYLSGGILLSGGDGNDDLRSGALDPALYGGVGDDSLRGGSGQNTLSGGAGNDDLTGGSGVDTFSFGADWDHDTVHDFSVGADILDMSGTGLSYDDLTISQQGADVLIQGAGNSITIAGANVADFDEGGIAFGVTLSGGSGDDAIGGTAGNDSLSGGCGDDTIMAGCGDDVIIGGAGSDVIDAGDGDDTVVGVENTADAGGGALALAAAPGASGATLDVDQASNFITVDGDGLGFTFVGGKGDHQAVAATEAMESGQYYWEQTLDDVSGKENKVYLGLIAPSGADFSEDMSDIDGLLLIRNGKLYMSRGGKLKAIESGLPKLEEGDTLMVAFDADTGALWLGVNGQWVNGATAEEIAAGDTSNAVLTDLEGTYVPIAAGYATKSNEGHEVTMGFYGEDLVYTPPEGFGPYGSGPSGDYGDADTIRGGAGEDWIDFSSSALGIDMSAGIMSAHGNTDIAGDIYSGFEHIHGSNNADWLAGSNGDNRILGGCGDDTIALTAGDDTLDGGAGTDTLVLTEGACIDFNNSVHTGFEAVVGSSEADVIQNPGNADFTFHGRGGDDYAFSGLGDDTLLGGSGHDTLYGRAGDDLLEGHCGDDELFGDDGEDLLMGGAGDDTLIGANRNDTLEGGDGNDVIVVVSDEDVARGGNGDDLIQMGNSDVGEHIGNADISGGCGDDTLSFAYYDDGNLDIDLAAGLVERGGYTDTLEGIEAVIGSSSNDTIRSSSCNDTIAGGAGDDDFVFAANSGADVITDFTRGEDTIDFSAQLLDFGDLVITAVAGGAQVATPDGSTIFLVGANADALSSSDFYFGETYFAGSNGDDNIEGQLRSETIEGGAGDDTLDGGNGDDTVMGGEGCDDVYGGAGDDMLRGGNGDDRLVGGTGDDTIYAGGGDDTVAAVRTSDGESPAALAAPGASGATLDVDQASNFITVDADGLGFTFVGGKGDQQAVAATEAMDAGQYYWEQTLDDVSGKENKVYLGLIAPSGADFSEDMSDIDGLLLIRNGKLYMSRGGKLKAIESGLPKLEEGDTLMVAFDADTGALWLGVNGQWVNGATAEEIAAGDTSNAVLTDLEGTYVPIAAGYATKSNEGHEVTMGFYGEDLAYEAPEGYGAYGTGAGSAAGGMGADRVFGGDGEDWLDLSGLSGVDMTGVRLDDAGGAAIAGGCYDGFEHILGSNGDDVLAGGSGDNRILGGCGDDTLIATAGNDTLDGGAGTDTVLLGGSGSYSLNRLVDIERITGSAGHDTLAANTDGVLVDMGDGDDLVYVTSNADTLVGGCGDDTVSFAGSDTGVRVNLAANSDFDIRGFEAVEGSACGDLLAGGACGDSLMGGCGDDTLVGRAGCDDLSGGAGADTVTGGNGDDTLAGGAGCDDFVYGDGWGQDTITDFTDGEDILNFAASSTSFGDLTISQQGANTLIEGEDGNQILLEGVTATDITAEDFSFGETLTGTAGADSLVGGPGREAIYGGNGDDTLDGGGFDDMLYGGCGDDVIIGGAGSDYINAGAGNDTVQALEAPAEGPAALAAPGASGATLDVDQASNFITVDADGLGFTFVGGKGDQQAVAATEAMDAGQYYWEQTLDDVSGKESKLYLGLIAPSGADFSEDMSDIDGLLLIRNGKLYMSRGGKLKAIESGLPKLEEGDTLMIAFDADTGALWLGVNGQWVNGATAEEIAAGDTSNTIQTDLEGTYVPIAAGYATKSNEGHEVTMGFYGEDLAYEAPEGYGAYGTGAGSAAGGDPDTVMGGAGEDWIDFSASRQGVDMAEAALDANGDTTVAGDVYQGFEHILGTANDDYLAGNAGNNQLVGGNGDDTLVGGGGEDTLFGGAGYDVAVGAGSGTVLVGIEALAGTEGGDTLSSNEDIGLFGLGGDDMLTGGCGDQILNGGAGDDTLYAITGDDTLIGGAGADTFLIGDNGHDKDIAVYDFNGDEDTLSFNIDRMDGETFTEFAVETQLNGEDGTLLTEVNGGSVWVEGVTVGDLFFTPGQTAVDGDRIKGKNRSEELEGTAGDDEIDGRKGDDTLVGGAGDDTLTGSKGADVFVFGNNDGFDLITDFDEDDLLDLTGAGVSGDSILEFATETTVGGTSGVLIATEKGAVFVQDSTIADLADQVVF